MQKDKLETKKLLMKRKASNFYLHITVKYMKSRRFETQTFGLRKGDMEHTKF